jgi:hypothetical protein
LENKKAAHRRPLVDEMKNPPVGGLINTLVRRSRRDDTGRDLRYKKERAGQLPAPEDVTRHIKDLYQR